MNDLKEEEPSMKFTPPPYFCPIFLEACDLSKDVIMMFGILVFDFN